VGGPTWRWEDEALRAGARLVAGCDEAGRGCLAGPVIAAAVILDREDPIDGVDDSKVLPPARREALAREIAARARAVGIGAASADEVDRVNVLRATRRAMRRAVEALDPGPAWLLLDAVRLADVRLPQVSLIRGDSRCMSIAAASIVAKVVRDRVMAHYAEAYPSFAFGSNKGYGTPAHVEALGRLGPCPIHRRTFRGVAPEQRRLDFEP
jgi:ribonuclease HII